MRASRRIVIEATTEFNTYCSPGSKWKAHVYDARRNGNWKNKMCKYHFHPFLAKLLQSDSRATKSVATYDTIKRKVMRDEKKK